LFERGFKSINLILHINFGYLDRKDLNHVFRKSKDLKKPVNVLSYISIRQIPTGISLSDLFPATQTFPG